MTVAAEQLSGCFWQVASASQQGIVAARTAAAAHREGSIHIATCQRIEIYSMPSCGCEAPTQAAGRDALLHLAEVAAGLHAAVLGETQVLGQVRDAVSRAAPGLRRAGDVAIAAARDLRREARFHADTSQNLDHALRIAGVPAGGHLLVLGAGHMGKTIARRARSMGFANVTVAVRDIAERELPTGADQLIELNAIAGLRRVDVAVGCLGDRNGSIELGELPAAKLFVDLGTPANFPATLPNRVTISNLVADEAPAMAARRSALRDRLGELLDRRLAHADQTSATPAGRLRAEIEAIRAREALAIERLHPELSREAVEAITRRLVNQIFHLPSSRLKQETDAEFGSRVADLFASSPERNR